MNVFWVIHCISFFAAKKGYCLNTRKSLQNQALWVVFTWFTWFRPILAVAYMWKDKGQFPFGLRPVRPLLTTIVYAFLPQTLSPVLPASLPLVNI